MSNIIENGSLIKIVVHVNREAAILAGKSRWGDHVVALDPAELTEQQRQTMVKCPVDHESRLPKVSVSGPDASLESIQQTLDKIHQACLDEAAKEAAREAKYRADVLEQYRRAVELPLDQCVVEDYGFGNYRDLNHGKWWGRTSAFRNLLDPSSWGAVKLPWEQTQYADAIRDKLEAVNDEIAKRNEQLYQERQVQIEKTRLESEEKKAAELAQVERRAAQVATWVLDHGTENQRARHTAGVLPPVEIERHIRDEAFATLDQECERYRRMDDKDVCKCRYDSCEVEFEVHDAVHMTADEWDMVDKIRKMKPNAKVVLRIHEGKGGECGNLVVKYSVLVTLDVGAFTFSREYCAPESSEGSETPDNA